MATSKDYISFITEQLSALGDIKVRHNIESTTAGKLRRMSVTTGFW